MTTKSGAEVMRAELIAKVSEAIASGKFMHNRDEPVPLLQLQAEAAVDVFAVFLDDLYADGREIPDIKPSHE